MNTVVSPPLVIGGLGGSGTRVVADMVLSLGWYLGQDLNRARDNQLFTLLFKRPSWRKRLTSGAPDFQRTINLFQRLTAGKWPRQSEWSILLGGVGDSIRHGHDYAGSMRGTTLDRMLSRSVWPLIRLAKIMSPVTAVHDLSQPWGWKEPNSHIYLNELSAHYPGMKYIHVIRNGLDMAYSANQAQLHNWGDLFDMAVAPGTTGAQRAQQSLEFWIRANTRAIEQGRNRLGDRFLLINFDDLCRNPEPQSQRLCDFLGSRCQRQELETLVRIPRIPTSLGRFRAQDRSIFGQQQIDAVRRLGFSTD
jgi:hypothetical protein